MQKNENLSDKEYLQLKEMSSTNFFRWFQRKYLFTNPDISILAGKIADEEEKWEGYDEWLQRTYGYSHTESGVRKPRFRLGETQGEDKETD